MLSLSWFFIGIAVYAAIKILPGCLYTVSPDQRAVKTSFGAAQILPMVAESPDIQPPIDPSLSEDERKRYEYPQVRVIRPGGPYFKLPWENVYKVSVATQAIDISWDPSKAQSTIEAVTKDNLTTGVNGQIRYRVSENNLYPYLFGVSRPLEHVMGYFVSVLRERIANFVDPRGQSLVDETELQAEGSAGEATTDENSSGTAVELSEGVSINDLRKNLPLLNQYMEEQCRSTTGRYGIELDAALITEIDPPPEVDRALSAINSTRNQVAADISTARADAEQQITMSARAVEIATNNAQAEVAPLQELAGTLSSIKKEGGSDCLRAYLRNARVPLFSRAGRVVMTEQKRSS
ncbi:Regulator of protease activity HflC, stomatin/prohibitin superfamily [Neorhodopirellula lusitana]|uniref:Regulator of protease activity HflC, stomatin/prohibitin superfamily n=1 Tax=Neorhodopirellula lusitana TaxID=445327 RepID=A0ABY1Q6E3_9BACT|nr:SPFH domain-containing protein [Neorhodopirellula lusitana]SMP58554.1 Regulator of protease activity HflC, stomatin/prohibitin superfamily [Neorhodopirellula lusitana]